ncbi:Fucoxanthin-chlorophyll a-c binding protein C [Durusdinium trenchii]|uniref:Chloroplastic n=1 Tax=Durusdinium trenchii TaxID=1381693 RepID=A0ABP0KAK4_9DINO
MAVATAAATVAESSPFVLATGAAGAVAVAGGLALMKASEHRPDMAQRLRRQVSERPRRQLAPPVPERGAKGAAAGWEAPGELSLIVILELRCGQGGGADLGRLAMAAFATVAGHAARVHGFSLALRSPGEAPPEQLGLTALLSEAEPSSSSRDDQLVLGRRFWGDLVFLFLLWLDFNPHTPNWGSSPSYGLPPMHLCWHNRWREDLRHVVSDFARYLCSDHIKAALPEKEWSQAACLIAMLDHLLSWEVTTLDRGSSDLIQASWWKYPDFCQKLQERFAEAWAATMAPPEAEVECRSFETHAEAMAEREIPESFREMWCQFLVASTERVRAGSGMSSEEEADQVLRQVAEEEDLLRQVPAGFEAEATLLAANLPKVSALEVGSHFAWYAPVVRVTRLGSCIFGRDASYLISFVDPESVTSVLQRHGQVFTSGGLARPIRLRRLPSEAPTSSWFAW